MPEPITAPATDPPVIARLPVTAKVRSVAVLLGEPMRAPPPCVPSRLLADPPPLRARFPVTARSIKDAPTKAKLLVPPAPALRVIVLLSMVCLAPTVLAWMLAKLPLSDAPPLAPPVSEMVGDPVIVWSPLTASTRAKFWLVPVPPVRNRLPPLL